MRYFQKAPKPGIAPIGSSIIKPGIQEIVLISQYVQHMESLDACFLVGDTKYGHEDSYPLTSLDVSIPVAAL